MKWVIYCVECNKPCRGPLDFALHITIPKYAHHDFEIREVDAKNN